MTAELPPAFLQRLIAVGESQDFSTLQQPFAEFPRFRAGQFTYPSQEFWHSTAESLSNAKLEALIRGITIAERDISSFNGGSVSGIIWLFRCLEQRKQGRPDDLADWVLANTSNPWAPFGNYNEGGARSLAEWDAYVQRRDEHRVASLQRDKELHAMASEGKAEKATKDIFSAIRRKDTKAVQALLLRGARLDVPNATGRTALAYAQSLGHTPILVLLEGGIKRSEPSA